MPMFNVYPIGKQKLSSYSRTAKFLRGEDEEKVAEPVLNEEPSVIEGQSSVEEILEPVSKDAVKASKKKKSSQFVLESLSSDEIANKRDEQVNSLTKPVYKKPRHNLTYTKEHRNAIRVTLHNKGFERDMY
jgi:hypothetical protein